MLLIVDSSSGEKLSNDEWDACCEDCMDEENDDGEIPYIRKFV